MIKFARRVANLERTQPNHDIGACLLDLKKGLHLPLPDSSTQNEIDEGFQKLVEIQRVGRADESFGRAETQKLLEEFRVWTDSIHEKYKD